MNDSGADIWSKALNIIKEELPNEQTFNIWFAPVKCASCTSEKLILEVPNKFFQDWLLNRYMPVISSCVAKACGSEMTVEFVIGAAQPGAVMAEIPKREESRREGKGFWPFAKHATDHAKDIGLDPKYTFDSFVIGSSNRFAHAAAMAVSDSPAKAYNPLFIYGGTGLGKTHLMHAIGERVLQKNPKTKVLYISSEDFTNQMINAIQNRSMTKFRDKYRSVDILLIDDVHFIAGKDSTQEEFFHTFNTLYDAHKQIVVTSDRPPKEINKLEERLVSRFLYGLVTDVQPPDFETRIAILKRKSEIAALSLPEDFYYFLAEKVKTNIRELEGALIRVVAYSTLIGKEVSVDLAKEVLKDMLIEGEKKITIDLIQKIVSEYFDIKLADMRSKKRSQAIAYPRQIAMYLTRQLTDYSLPEIGDQFGGRDHTTVIHACNKIESDLNTKDGFKALIGRLIESIKG